MSRNMVWIGWEFDQIQPICLRVSKSVFSTSKIHFSTDRYLPQVGARYTPCPGFLGFWGDSGDFWRFYDFFREKRQKKSEKFRSMCERAVCGMAFLLCFSTNLHETRRHSFSALWEGLLRFSCNSGHVKGIFSTSLQLWKIQEKTSKIARLSIIPPFLNESSWNWNWSLFSIFFGFLAVFSRFGPF